MSDIWQELTEGLAKPDEELGVYTSSFISPTLGPLYINVELLSKGDLIGVVKISHRPSLEEFNANLNTLATTITKAGFIQVRESHQQIQGIAYLKPDDPRREWGIVGMSLEQTQQVIQHLQDPRFETAVLGYAYCDTVYKTSVFDFNLVCRGSLSSTVELSCKSPSRTLIDEEIRLLAAHYGWKQVASYFDPRGGIEGDFEYARS